MKMVNGLAFQPLLALLVKMGRRVPKVLVENKDPKAMWVPRVQKVKTAVLSLKN
jgi:hypothetical protein